MNNLREIKRFWVERSSRGMGRKKVYEDIRKEELTPFSLSSLDLLTQTALSLMKTVLYKRV